MNAHSDTTMETTKSLILNGIFGSKPIPLLQIMEILDTNKLSAAVEILDSAMCRYKNDDIAIKEYENGKMEKELRQVHAVLVGLNFERALDVTDEYLQGMFTEDYKIYLSNNWNRHFLRNRVGQILADIRRDLSNHLFLQLNKDDSRNYNSSTPFGTITAKAFPQIEVDSQEAVRCLITQRYTAAGMHCMRIMEKIVEMVAKKAKISLYDEKGNSFGWHKLAEMLDSKVKKIGAGESVTKSKYKVDMSAALSHLLLVKHVRNALQHPNRRLEGFEAEACVSGTGHFLNLVARQNLLRKTAIHLK